MAEESAGADGDVGVRFASRIGHHTLIYALGWGATFTFSIVNVLVLTRYLSVSQFGELALLLVFAAMLTIVYNAGLLQGSFLWVFGAGEDDASDGRPTDSAQVGEKRRALGTALLTTIAVAAIGTLLLIPFSDPLGEFVLGREDGGTIAWASLSGALGAVWRLVSNILRFELRPVAFVVVNNLRPVLVVSLTVPAVASGLGVEGAIAGTALGTLLSVAGALALTWKNYVLAFDLRHLNRIARLGAFYVPIIGGIWVVQNVDQYLLAAFSSAEQVGYYRLASRIAAVVSYFVSAFLMAWAPLMQTSLQEAVVRRHGHGGAGATAIFYYAVAATWLLVALALLADLLVQLAPPAYGEAARLIPLLGVGFMVYGLFIVIYRGARFPAKRRAYIGGALISAVCFLASALLLIPVAGAEGAALAVVLGFFAGCVLVLLLSQLGPEPMPIPYWRIGGTGFAGVAVFGAAHYLGAAAGPLRVPVEVLAALFGVPAAVILASIVPPHHVSLVRETVTSSLRRLAGRRGDLGPAVERLAPRDREVVNLAVRRRMSAAEVGRVTGDSAEAVHQRVANALWMLTAEPSARSFDPAVGEYLLSRDARAERNVAAQRLWSQGVSPDHLDLLEDALHALRRQRRLDPQPSGAGSRT